MIEPGVEHINRTGGVIAGALPLLYGMAEGIVVGATYEPPDTEPSARRPGPPPAAAGPASTTASAIAPPAEPAFSRGSAAGVRPEPRQIAGGVGSRPVVSGPVVGAVYSPIHSSFHAGSYCSVLQPGR